MDAETKLKLINEQIDRYLTQMRAFAKNDKEEAKHYRKKEKDMHDMAEWKEGRYSGYQHAANALVNRLKMIDDSFRL